MSGRVAYGQHVPFHIPVINTRYISAKITSSPQEIFLMNEHLALTFTDNAEYSGWPYR